MSGDYTNLSGYGGSNWQNAVPTYSQLPMVGNFQGDMRVTIDTGIIYTWLGTQWVAGNAGPITNVNLTQVGGTSFGLGQTTMALSIPVTLASNQSPISIAGTISGTVNSNVAGLNIFQSSQQTIGLIAVQVTPTPLTNRSSLSLRVTTTSSSAAIYIGPSSGVTVFNGYPLYNGDTLQMDLTPVNTIYAISNIAGQTLFILEIA